MLKWINSYKHFHLIVPKQQQYCNLATEKLKNISSTALYPNILTFNRANQSEKVASY